MKSIKNSRKFFEKPEWKQGDFRAFRKFQEWLPTRINIPMRGTTPSFKAFHQLERIRERFAVHGEIIGSGSGTIISPDGLLITASHVVKRGARAKILVGSKVYPAKIVKRFPDLDVLLLLIVSPRTDFPYSELIDCKKYPLGLPVFSVGFPNPEIEGYSPKYTESYVSASRGFMGKNTMVQFTADQGAGCSGAGLFDEDARVVGVVTAMLDKSQDEEDLPADVSFATKSGSFYAAVSKHLPVPVKNKPARNRNGVIETATRSSVLVLATE